jgi:thiamine monophosphate synthase
MTRLAITAFVLLCAVDAFAQKTEPIRLYLFTAPSQFVDEAYKNRRDTLADLRRHLTGKKEVQLVEARGDADATVEVLERAREDADRDTYERNVNARMRVVLSIQAGAYSTELKGDGKPSMTERRSAAKDAGNKVLEWVRENRDRLIAARTK